MVQTHPKQQTLSSNFGTAETLVTANDVWPSFQHNIPVSTARVDYLLVYVCGSIVMVLGEEGRKYSAHKNYYLGQLN